MALLVRRSGLLRRYLILIASLVSGTLLASALFEIYFSYRDSRGALVRLQREKATASASRIQQFIEGLENQVAWTTQSPWSARAMSLEERRLGYLTFLRLVPPVTSVSYLDPDGREQVKVSRLAMDIVGAGTDFSHDPKFLHPKAGQIYFGPVYFLRDSVPYMTIAMAGSGRDAGVTAAEVNLKFVWDVIAETRLGRSGRAYVVDGRGDLIAHPDLSLVLKKTNLAALPQVKAAIAGRDEATEETAGSIAVDLDNRQVLTVDAAIAPLGWFVFLEQPLGEAFAPLYALMLRSALLVVVGLGLSIVASFALATKMATPIRELQAGALQVGAGLLDHRIRVETGDELQELADGFNRMAGQLQESYTSLEQKVEQRTAELREALEQQTATSRILHVLANSPTELNPVFDAITSYALRLCQADVCVVYLHDQGSFDAIAFQGAVPAFEEFLRRGRVQPGPGTALGQAARRGEAIHIADITEEAAYRERDPVRVASAELQGVRTMLAVPMLHEAALVGVVTLGRHRVQPFSDKQIALTTIFANQAAIALEDFRLFQQLQARTRELARSVEELEALADVTHAVSSTLDVQTVLTTIVARAVALSGGDAGVIYEHDEASGALRLRATDGLTPELLTALETLQISSHGPIESEEWTDTDHLMNILTDGSLGAKPDDLLGKTGFQWSVGVPLSFERQNLGLLVILRYQPGALPSHALQLLQTFAGHSVLAIHNARLFRQVQEKSRQLEVASQHKSQFLANMSHELRTPLNAILGYAELILDGVYGDIPGQINEVMVRVEKSGRHLLGLINDVLDLSKIEAGRLRLTLDEYSMSEVVQAVLMATESLASEKKLGLKATVASNLPLGRGDERRLMQVVLNLVGNAIKFTEVGEIRIDVAACEGRFIVSVTDTGPGVADEDHDRIFEEFHQVDTSSTKQKGGTGLGLAISKRIVEMHGGRIWIESTVGRGSAFRFTIPVHVERAVEIT